MRTKHLFSRSLLPVLVLLIFGSEARAQFNAWSFSQKYENKFAHFGILMGYNASQFRLRQSEDFLFNDSIFGVESFRGPGFNLGIVSNVHLGKHFDLRFLPNMAFAERNLNYTLTTDTTYKQTIESINVELPVLLKFKSDPYKDFRVYVLAGMKYTYDLASNAKARNAEGLVKIARHDLLMEYGIGFEIYFPYFIFAPELRFSQGLFDIHALDSKLTFSNVLDRLFTRSFSIVINFEG